MQASQSATGRAAEAMGRGDIGAIVPGRYADFVAVKADPLADIGVLETIDHVMKGGVLVRSHLAHFPSTHGEGLAVACSERSADQHARPWVPALIFANLPTPSYP